MFRAGKLPTSVEYSSPRGPVVLTGDVWWVAVATLWGGTAAAYHRPHRVTWGDVSMGIVDYLMVARLSLIALVLGRLLRRLTR
jgi:hypothetical protein